MALWQHTNAPPNTAKPSSRSASPRTPTAQKCYDPDGGYPEGFSYWDYGTGFEVMLVAALQSALGTDAGIAAQESFMRSASFMTYMVAPSGRCYNFYDSGSGASCIPAKYWFARQTMTPRSWPSTKGSCSRDASFGPAAPRYTCSSHRVSTSRAATCQPRATWVNYGIAPVFIYRSGWNSPDDTYFAIKGGRASSNHAHNGCRFVHIRERRRTLGHRPRHARLTISLSRRVSTCGT